LIETGDRNEIAASSRTMTEALIAGCHLAIAG